MFRIVDLVRAIFLYRNDLGNGEDIDRSAVLQGVFTPSFGGVRTTVFFHIEFDTIGCLLVRVRLSVISAKFGAEISISGCGNVD